MVARSQTNFRLDDSERGRLVAIADSRYRGNRTDAIRAALDVLDVVLATPAAATVDPNNAAALLAAYCEGRER